MDSIFNYFALPERRLFITFKGKSLSNYYCNGYIAAMTCGYLLNKASFRSSVDFVLVFSGTMPAAFSFTSLSPLLHRRSLCEGTRFSALCRGQTAAVRLSQNAPFLTGLFHDVFIFNIDD